VHVSVTRYNIRYVTAPNMVNGLQTRITASDLISLIVYTSGILRAYCLLILSQTAH
jgi:hypothetical protein